MALSESFFDRTHTGPTPVAVANKRRGAEIAVQDISHSYGRGDAVLDGIDFAIEPGSVVALLGRSGCGKSTLLHILAGLTRPSSGNVEISGARVRGPSPKWVMMFQAPSLYPWMSVAETAALGLRFGGRIQDANQRVPRILDLVELTEFADRNVQDLSGGQQQRAALARSLATDPDVLLLDEPFSALDIFTRQALQRDVRAIARRMGMTVVLVSHDVSEAVTMADRVIVMASGPGRISEDVTLDLSEADRNDPASDALTHEISRVSRAYGAIAANLNLSSPHNSGTFP
ncbi:MAG: ABC transporter ATP-binding protein [Pseudomonadota bacterium]